MTKYFEGWYFKHQANGKSLAVIPGRAADEAFIWVITHEKSFHIKYPLSEYRADYNKKSMTQVKVGNNVFSTSGVVLDISRDDISLSGTIDYSYLVPIDGNIMGPFQYVPMECTHGIISMNHALSGSAVLNGETLDFNNGKGYIESDSGRSFPSAYTWAHCNAFDANCSIMASVARIPFYGLRFWGCIAVVWLNGKEYRLATYNGVKILRCEPGIIMLKRGKSRLNIDIKLQDGQALPAPQDGLMSRIIKENLQCTARFQFIHGEDCLFDSDSHFASYECMLNGQRPR